MDTDSDIDNFLSQQLSCMVTSDKETLIRHFQQLLGEASLTPEMCAFFLEMSNWNLQAAVGAYYDYGIANNAHLMGESDLSQLNLGLVKDVTIGEGESVPPNTRFVKTWRIRNTGKMHWPQGSQIYYMEGTKMTTCESVPVECVPPDHEIEVSVEMQSPSESGMYQTRWQLNTPQRFPVGESIWCIITVDANGILDITQQMASTPLGGNRTLRQNAENPFIFPHIPSPTTSNSFAGFGDGIAENNAYVDMEDLSDQLNRTVRGSLPVDIPREDIPGGPPCTPCTPPDCPPNQHMWE